MFTCFSNILDIVGRIEIGRWSEGSDFDPPLKIGNTLAHFSRPGTVPDIMLLLTKAASIGDKALAAIFIIFGPRPSSPVALEESKSCIYDCTCYVVINGR